MSAARAALEIYDRHGAMVRSVPLTRDAGDTTKWHLAEHVSLGGPHAETAVIRLGDGTSEPLPPSLFTSSHPINTIFL